MKYGDKVRNVNPHSRYYEQVKGKIGVYVKPIPCEGQPPACDVVYPGVTDLYGRSELAQREDDLERVQE